MCANMPGTSIGTIVQSSILFLKALSKEALNDTKLKKLGSCH